MRSSLLEPMLAKLTPTIPVGPGWLFEPKWDGLRCIVYFDGEKDPYLQSRDLKGVRACRTPRRLNLP